MEGTKIYYQAHLVVSAIRVLEYQQKRPPSDEDLSEALSFSPEQTSLMIRKLVEMEIISAVEGSYGIRLFIKDHLKLEDIPQNQTESKLDEALKKFQDSRKDLTQKVESFKAQQDEKKKSLFAELEKKLKKSSSPKSDD
ncbi:MAG: hypothetical protein K9L30_08655 [Desulfobacterales bacterium]|nr:hypothetical protein [Desulfobacterales bacterium]